MRNFQPGKESGHDHFFATFIKYLPILMKHRPEMVNEAVERACREHLIYLKLMVMPDDNRSGLFGSQITYDNNFDDLLKKLLNQGVIPITQEIYKQLDRYQKTIQVFLSGPEKEGARGLN